MRKIKSKFLTICALFFATITCTAFGVFASIDNKEEITVAKAENVEVMNENWTATPTLRWDLWNSMYKVTLSYSSAFNPTAAWVNNAADTSHVYALRDYLVLNGKTLGEIISNGSEINTQYPVTTDEGMLDNGATWNPVAVLVNTNNIEIQINRNYLAPAGLEFGIKDGFSMTNGDVTYKTDGDVMFKLIPSTANIENVVAVNLDEASVTTKKSTFSVSRVSGWDKTNYDCYHIVSTALMNYGNNGRWLCDHFTYLNDYITVNDKPLAYWNTVTYDSSYDYSGAPASSRVYATPTFGQMYQSDTSTTIAVYLNRDWMTAQGITSPELGIKDGMLYVGRDGTTVYEEGTPIEAMNNNWTATPTLRWDLWNSMYKVTLSYPSAFNPTATWANDHATINGIDVRDYLVFNGETLKEIQAKGSEINSQYPVTTDEGMLDNGATWNPVSVLVNTNNIEIQINRNYLAPAGLEFGIKDGFSMTNNGVNYKVVGDMMFKLIPSTSNVENVTAVKLNQANITTNKATVTVSKSGTTGNYTKYQITTPATMAYGNNGRWLCDHFTYLNDYLTVNGKPLAYWNTVMYDSSYDYTGAPTTGRQYATPTFGQMYAQDGQTIMFVYVNNDLGLTEPEIGIADGMLYVGLDGTTVYKYVKAQEYAISFEEGASIRYITDNNADSGIRFTANVDAELANVATEVGMLIVPETYISAYNASGYTDYFTYFEEVKGKTKSSISATFDAEQIASGKIKGCIVGIKDANWNRSYQAVTYYIAGGEYYYSAPSDARTIAYVADKAITDTEADYSDTLKNSLATIVKKSIDSKYSDTADVSGGINQTVDLNMLFNYGLSGTTTWSIVSGTSVTLSGAMATIQESGTSVLRFSAYEGKLTKDVTLNVDCTSQTITIKNYFGGAAATAPAFTLNETTGFTTGNFYINDTTNTTNGTMILNGEERIVFQGGSYNASNGAYQFINLASDIGALVVGDVIILEKGTTFSQGDNVYVLAETTGLKYYNTNTWIVYTVDGEITITGYGGGSAADAPAFTVSGETDFTEGWFYVNNTVQNTNGNMILNGEEKVVFKAGYYWASNGLFQLRTLADGISFSAGDVLTLKKGTTFSQGVGTLVYVLTKTVDLIYTGSSWTVMNYDGKISVANYYGGNAATAPAFTLNEATGFVSGNFYINDTTNTTNGTMILNGEERIVFQGGSYNANNGAYQFVNLASDITFVANDLLILEKGTTFSQGDLVYVLTADTYLMYTGSAWTLDIELQTLSLDAANAYALSNAIVSDTDLALEGNAMEVTINGNTTVDGSSVNLTAVYYPSPINKFMLKNEGMTGKVVIPEGSVFVIENAYYQLENEFLCYVEDITIEDTNAEYYTFADLPPRGWEEFLQPYFDLGLSTYQLTTDCFQFITNGELDATYTGAIDLVDRLGGNTLIRNMGLSDVAATVDYFDSHGAALMNGWDNKISGFYMADEYTSDQYKQLGDLITWKNTYASDKLWHMNMVGSLSYDHWNSGFTGNWWQDLGKNDATFQATYGTHVDDYINNVVKKLNGGTASVCLDCYPFREVGAGEIYNYYLYDLLTVANKTKAYNDSRATTGTAEARFGICLQTYQFIQPSGDNVLGRDIASAAEVSMQIYTGLAMGADLFEYFAYCSNTFSDGSEKTNGIVTQTPYSKEAGEKRIYDLVKTANDNALPFAKITMAYDWLGTFVSAGTTSNENSSAFNLINGLVTSDKGAMTSISSTYDAIIGRYEGSEGDGYMVVNYTDPTKAHTNTVNMNFNGYNYAIVYTAGGEAQLVALNSGALSLNLAAGEAAFVIPMA